MFQNYIKFADLLILRVSNCERVGRADSSNDFKVRSSSGIESMPAGPIFFAVSKLRKSRTEKKVYSGIPDISQVFLNFLSCRIDFSD